MRFTARASLIALISFSCLSAEEAKQIPVVEWKAIIAFFPGTPMEVSGDWNWFLDDIYNHFIEDSDFHLVQYFDGDDMNINITGPDDELIASFDIAEYAGENAGYIFIMKDREPLWCDYEQSYIVIEQAESYFRGD